MMMVIAQLIMLLIGSDVMMLSAPVVKEKSIVNIMHKHELMPVTILEAALTAINVTKFTAEAVKNNNRRSSSKDKLDINEVSVRSIYLASNRLVTASSNQNKSITKKNETVYKSNYIKYDSTGKPLPDDAVQWSCVYDMRTGLMWEVKSPEGGLRYSKNLYSWYSHENTRIQGEPDGGRCQGGIDCDTDAYVQAMNAIKYCGYDEWYLPSREEMQTLIVRNNQNRKQKITIDTQYFPQTVPSWYWTASEHEEHDEFAWFILFRNGLALSDLKERAKHIRLVRKTLSSNL